MSDVKHYRDGSTNVVVTAVDIFPCNQDPCRLVKGTSVTIRIRFRSIASIIAGDARFEGSFGGRPVLLPFAPNGVCRRLNPPCPILPGRFYVYSYTDVIPQELRSGLLNVRWKLLNASGVEFLCVDFSIQIVEDS
ncbi:Niemann-Pick C2 protein [Clonorchis sinensis]|uniref:Niemann-Pick C2 protein n=1 Tax=Clonorchis sinensis TaxID=79923 RepID=G7YSH3_CLOSI|nr:Niemann-Pick C2 protein [Clonorchis sinensis]